MVSTLTASSAASAAVVTDCWLFRSCTIACWRAVFIIPLRAAFIFGLRIKVAGVVALMQLLIRRAEGAVNHAAALHCRAFSDRFRPALDVFVAARVKELRRIIDIAQHHVAVPWQIAISAMVYSSPATN